MDLSDHNQETEEETRLIGTAEILRKAMQVTNLSEMIDCFNQLKSSSASIERDLPNYFRNRPMNQIVDSAHLREITDIDLIRFTEESSLNRRYILLHELIEQNKRLNMILSSKQKSHLVDDRDSSSLDNQVKIMRHVIAAQPSALEGLYLEALLNPDQWPANHHRLQTSPQETLTLKERQRLKELLNQSK